MPAPEAMLSDAPEACIVLFAASKRCIRCAFPPAGTDPWKFSVRGTAVGTDGKISLSVSEVGTGVVQNAAVSPFDQHSLPGFRLHRLTGMPVVSVIIAEEHQIADVENTCRFRGNIW